MIPVKNPSPTNNPTYAPSFQSAGTYDIGVVVNGKRLVTHIPDGLTRGDTLEVAVADAVRPAEPRRCEFEHLCDLVRVLEPRGLWGGFGRPLGRLDRLRVVRENRPQTVDDAPHFFCRQVRRESALKAHAHAAVGADVLVRKRHAAIRQQILGVMEQDLAGQSRGDPHGVLCERRGAGEPHKRRRGLVGRMEIHEHVGLREQRCQLARAGLFVRRGPVPRQHLARETPVEVGVGRGAARAHAERRGVGVHERDAGASCDARVRREQRAPQRVEHADADPLVAVNAAQQRHAWRARARSAPREPQDAVAEPCEGIIRPRHTGDGSITQDRDPEKKLL